VDGGPLPFWGDHTYARENFPSEKKKKKKKEKKEEEEEEEEEWDVALLSKETPE
jgi:hypothetical protein